MKRTVLEQARNLMRRRKFGMATRLLESYAANYRGSFEYYLALGTSCLYLDDEGNAAKYYQAARDIHVNSSELLLGQAAIFLRHGNNAKALQYYLDVLDMDPNNQVAKDAMEFIRTRGKDFSAVQKLKSNGGIKKYYPQVGTNPDIIRNCILGGIVFVLAVIFAIVIWPSEKMDWAGNGVPNLALTPYEKRNALADELSSKAVHYILGNDDVEKCYDNAGMYWANHRDNPARVEINRILNSNASVSIKTKALELQGRLSKVTFDNLIENPGDNYSYSKVEEDPVLYEGCYVAWAGTIANLEQHKDGTWTCQLLVGYHDGEHVEGTVDVVFQKDFLINPSKPIKILGIVCVKSGKIYLDGTAIHQFVKGGIE